MVGFDIKPSRRRLAVEGDVEGGRLQHCDPGLVVDGGVEVAKEGQIGGGVVGQAVQPEQRVTVFAIG